MNIIIESNIDCSFMQKIIKLPQYKDELTHAYIDNKIIDLLQNYLIFVSELKIKFNKYNHIVSFIENCILNDNIYYVKTFSDDIEDLTENREYICFGEYHRKSKGRNLFIRIDQKWDNFDFTFFHKIPDSIKLIKLLSGTTVGLLLPEIIATQEYLNDNSYALEYLNMTLKDFENYYLIATRSFGKEYFIDIDGNIFYKNKDERTMINSNLNFEQWLDNELNNIFEPKTKETE